MDMSLYLTKVQQRWRYADDDLAPGETVCLDVLAHDIQLEPDALEGAPEKAADTVLDLFFAPRTAGTGGGSIEPADETDEEHSEAGFVQAPPTDLEPPQFETTGEHP
jgi:type IV secretion system protein VirD4